MRTYLRMVAMLLSLFAASLEAGEFAVGDTIDLALPDGLPSFSLSIVAAPPAGIAGQSYIARDAHSQASAIVKPTKGGLRVTIDDFENQKIYSVRVKDSVVEATVRDTSCGDDGVCGTCGGDLAAPPQEAAPAEANAAPASKPRASRLKSAMLGASDAFPVAEQKAVVDILVAFDHGAKTWVEGGGRVSGDTVEEFADYAVNKMNMVLEKSQLDDKFFYRLVGIVEVDASYDVIDTKLLDALRLRNSGALAPVGTAREKCGADTITLLIDRDRDKSTTSGQGYEYLSNSWSYAAFDAAGYTCNICDIKTVYERYTMSHETGHNMGCGHSNRQGKSSGPGCHPYSCGYHFEDASGAKRYTIMAYDNTSPASGTYSPVPYFSSPDITPEDLGVPVGTPTNNNRLTILNNYKDVAAWREHVVPYDWDVRFLDDGGKDIPDGSYFYSSCYVTLTNENPEAEIYYTLDGSSPTAESPHGGSGTKVYMYLVSGLKTLTACAVVDGKAQSVRSITLYDGLTWSGDSSGSGFWLNADSSVRPWDGEYFYDGDAVSFPDLAGVSCATVTVKGVVAPGVAAFSAIETAYLFDKGDDVAKIAIPNADFAPSGGLTFNVPVQMSATSFTTPVGCTVAFNAPFGQVLESLGGYCTNRIVVGNGGTLTVAPGADKTQTFDSFNNAGNYYSSATLQIGEGTVVFNGPANGSKGLFGSTKIAVGDGGSLVFNVGGATGSGVSSTLTVSRGGTVTFNEMEHMNRKLVLDGGTVRCKRLDWMYGTTISATADSSIVENGSDGYVWIRFADATVDVSDGATLTLDIPISTGYNTADFGFVKTGGGELAANRPMSHTGATVISNGTVAIGYSSSTRVGLGWTVKNGATLKLKSGCALAVPMLVLESGATLALPATTAAPLSATNEVNLSGVCLSLDGASDLSEGKSYPILSSTGGFSGVSGIATDGLPALADGLMWKAEVDDGTLYAKVVRDVLNIPIGETVSLSDVPSSVVSVTGGGTLLCNGSDLTAGSLAALRGYVANDGWTGTVAFTNYAATTLALDWYGGASSTVRLTGVSGYPGSSGGTNIYFHTAVELVDGADGKPAWTLNNGFSTDCTFIDRLRGDGTFKSTLSPSSTYVRQGFVVADASGFTGSLELVGTQFTFGSTARKNDSSQTGTIYVDAGYSVTNAASWKADGLVVNGELVKKGTLTIANSVVFGGGASFVVDSLPANGVVLTSKAITTNGALSVCVIGDDRSYVASIVDNGDSTVSLVFERAPLPETVVASITVRYWGDDGWEDRQLSRALPTGWATNYYPSLDTVAAVAAKYDDVAANGAKVWQCYMLGLDPTDAQSGVSLLMTVAGAKIRFAVGGLGETHEIAGVQVDWYLKSSTDIASYPKFPDRREYKTGLSPTFSDRDVPDTISDYSSQKADRLFYMLTVAFEATE